MMTAYRLVGWERPPEFMEVPVPEPGPGEVLVKIAAVGLCHTDLHFMHAAPGAFAYDLPFTLGHENAGWIEALGPGTVGLSVGDAVAIAGGPRCGRCIECLRGNDNICTARGIGRGFGLDGGLANYLVAPQREVVPLGSLDPRIAAPLPDAGVTSYHTVKRVVPKLQAGSTAVVIGAGGLGGYAVQYLRIFTPARVVAVDTAPHRLESARALGAHEVMQSNDTIVADVRELIGGRAEAVFDFVGTDATMQTALQLARNGGAVAIVGAAGGRTAVGWGALPNECDLFIPIGGTIADLHDVVTLAEQGRIRIDVEMFPFDQVADAYARVESGELHGRAVVTPND